MVCHLLGTVGDAHIDKGAFELSLVGSMLGALQDSFVGEAGDAVGLADHGDLVLVFDHTCLGHGLLEDGEVFVGKLEESDVVGDLIGDGVDGTLGVLGSQVGEYWVDLCGEPHLVDVVHLQRIVDADGEARPDDIVGVDRRDEEDGLVGLNVVDDFAIGEVATGEVVEEATLPAIEGVISYWQDKGNKWVGTD
jgi:hypothetical protein